MSFTVADMDKALTYDPLANPSTLLRALGEMLVRNAEPTNENVTLLWETIQEAQEGWERLVIPAQRVLRTQQIIRELCDAMTATLPPELQEYRFGMIPGIIGYYGFYKTPEGDTP